MARGTAGRARGALLGGMACLALAALAPPAPAQTAPAARPAITGTTQVNSVLTASLPGATDAVAYQWLRCDRDGENCVRLPGATGASYTLVVEDDARRMRVRATDAGVSTTSYRTAIIGAPINVEPPYFDSDDFTLRGKPGTWTPPWGRLEYRYEWQRCNLQARECVSITQPSDYWEYKLVAEDFATRIRMKLTATNRAGSTVAYSAPTAPIGKPRPSAYYGPKVSGVPTPGRTLTVTRGSWYPGDAKIDSFSFRWTRCDRDSTACDTTVGTTSAYVPTAADAGHRLRAVVTASNAAGTTSWLSTRTRVVGAPVVATRPRVTGTAKVGETLGATRGSWSPAATGYAYEWRRCYSGGKMCYSAGTGPTYTVTSNDGPGYATLQVRVTASNEHGSAVADSPPVAVAAEEQPPG